MDVVELAFSHGDRPNNWDHLARWFKANASQVNRVKNLVTASEQALADGVPFPTTADEARWILQKYSDRAWH